MICMIDEVSGNPPVAIFTVCWRWRKPDQASVSSSKADVDCQQCLDRLAKGYQPGEMSLRVRCREVVALLEKYRELRLANDHFRSVYTRSAEREIISAEEIAAASRRQDEAAKAVEEADPL